jgi:hypothetical protein
MLNEQVNAYQSLQVEKQQSKELTSDRERLRNQFIDQQGRKPTEAELDALLLSQRK